jgi:hypothetical protein
MDFKSLIELLEYDSQRSFIAATIMRPRKSRYTSGQHFHQGFFKSKKYSGDVLLQLDKHPRIILDTDILLH